MGLLDGVTTNPSLLAKSGKPMKKALAEICEIVDGPISGEVLVDRLRAHPARGARDRQDPQEHGGQGAAHPRGAARGEDVSRRGHPHQRHPLLLGQPGAARRQGGRQLHLAVHRPHRRHVARGDAAHRADHHHLPELRLRHRGAGGQRAQPDARSPGRAARRRHLHHALQGDRAARLPPAHRHRPQEVHRRREEDSARCDRADNRNRALACTRFRSQWALLATLSRGSAFAAGPSACCAALDLAQPSCRSP